MLLGAVCLYSCSSEMEEVEEFGYLSLELNTLVSTHTRAVTALPGAYDARTLHVELRKADGTIVLQTDEYKENNVPAEFRGNIRLTPGTYTIEAHSANWDGSDAGGEEAAYYAGETTVTVTKNTVKAASVTCTLANVKVTVNYDKSFIDYFTNVKTLVSSTIAGVHEQTFNMPEDNATVTSVSGGTAYFPVGGLNFRLTVTSKSSNQNYWQDFSIAASEVHARDYFKVNFKVSDSGTQDGITVYRDETTTTYTYDVYFNREPGISMSAAVKPVDVWAKFATVTGKVESKVDGFDATKVALQYKKASDLEWTSVPNSSLTAIDEDNYSYTIKGLDANTRYTFRYIHDVEGSDNYAKSAEVSFTTEAATALYNGDFEYWCTKSEGGRNIVYPNESNVNYWSSSNPSAAQNTLVPSKMASLTNEASSVTELSLNPVSGSKVARLHSDAALGVISAASIYTGSFVSMTIATKAAKLKWGVPFTSRPTALHGYRVYLPGTVDITSNSAPAGAPAEGARDHTQIYCALLTTQVTVDNSDMSTFPKWDGTDSRVIAYGEVTATSADNGWVELNIPLKYYNTTTKPSYILVVSSSSKYGDYFHGSSSSVLYLDNLELVYGDEVTTN